VVRTSAEGFEPNDSPQSTRRLRIVLMLKSMTINNLLTYYCHWLLQMAMAMATAVVKAATAMARQCNGAKTKWVNRR
jgi:hypothetical protein